jgi:hypothetical protein
MLVSNYGFPIEIRGRAVLHKIIGRLSVLLKQVGPLLSAETSVANDSFAGDGKQQVSSRRLNS